MGKLTVNYYTKDLEDLQCDKDLIEFSILQNPDLNRSFAYESCLRFDLPINFINHLTDGLSCLFCYEIRYLLKLNVISVEEYYELFEMFMNSSSINNSVKFLGNSLGIQVKDDKGKKNALFKVTENVYSLCAFPLLCSYDSLSKDVNSISIDFNKLALGRVKVIHKCTLISLLEKLKTSKSSVTKLVTLRRFLFMYKSDLTYFKLLELINPNEIKIVKGVKDKCFLNKINHYVESIIEGIEFSLLDDNSYSDCIHDVFLNVNRIKVLLRGD